MKKQIIYPKLVPRLFSSTLDLFILAIVALPVLQFFSSYLLVFFFKNYFIDNQIELFNYWQMWASMLKSEFGEYVYNNMSSYIGYNIIMFLLYQVVIGTYFVGFWSYKGSTPGKMFLHMKIVNATDFGRPTKWQLVKRFLGYMTFLFGIWFIIFSEKKQALHDKIAHTVVIKT